jgi:membrane protein implicated in regulation of membrane protease activity
VPFLGSSHSRRIRSRSDTCGPTFQLNSNLTAMEQTISQLLKSPVFWFGSVLVGLILNILSNRLSRHIDKWTDGWSAKRRKRLEEKKESFRVEVEILSKDPTELTILYIQLAKETILLVVIGLGLLMVSTIVTIPSVSLFISSILTLLFGLLSVLFFMILRSMMDRAEKCSAANDLRKDGMLERKLEMLKEREDLLRRVEDRLEREEREGGPTTTHDG